MATQQASAWNSPWPVTCAWQKLGAQFGLSHIAEGFIPFCGGTQRLPRIIGQARALELILTGKHIDATEAYQIGLVTEVIEPDHFAARVDEVLTDLLGKGPTALRLGKRGSAEGNGSDIGPRCSLRGRPVRLTPDHTR